MGAHKGVHVERRRDPRLRRRRHLARARRGRQEASAGTRSTSSLTGMASTDGAMGVVPRCSPSASGCPQVTFASELTVEDGIGDDPPRRRHRVRDDRGDAAGAGLGDRPDQRAALPLVQGDHGREEEAGRAAGRSPTSASTPRRSGLDAAWTMVESRSPQRPPREQGQIVTDEGDGGRSSPSSSPSQKFV